MMTPSAVKGLALMLLLIGAVACDGGNGGNKVPQEAVERVSARALAGKMGCIAFQPDQDAELFVREQGGCGFAEDEQGSYPTTIYTFTDAAARDNWLQAASAFGGGPLVVGGTWVVAVDTQCDPQNPCDAEARARDIQAKLGGEIR